MAFSPTVGTRVRIADQSSQWRGHSGQVMSIDDGTYNVRLDGFGVNQTAGLQLSSLIAEPLPSPYDYSNG